MRQGKDGEPFAVWTLLSWAVQGPMKGAQEEPRKGQLSTFITTAPERYAGDEGLSEQVRRFWELDEPTTREALEDESTSAQDNYILHLWDLEVTCN